jgi:hypothetical protein
MAPVLNPWDGTWIMASAKEMIQLFIMCESVSRG